MITTRHQIVLVLTRTGEEIALTVATADPLAMTLPRDGLKVSGGHPALPTSGHVTGIPPAIGADPLHLHLVSLSQGEFGRVDGVVVAQRDKVLPVRRLREQRNRRIKTVLYQTLVVAQRDKVLPVRRLREQRNRRIKTVLYQTLLNQQLE